jgi:FixJ family two-component response regulator
MGATRAGPTIMRGGDLFIVESDPKVIKAIGVIFGNAGWSVRSFNDGPSLVRSALDDSPSGVLIELSLPTCLGLDALSELRSHGYAKPVVVMSTIIDVPTVVEAMRRGATDFIVRPFRPELAFERMSFAVQAWRERQSRSSDHLRPDFPGHALLTKREIDVLRGIAAGTTAKEGAALLDISPRTVEFYRARILMKLGAKNSADLMRLVMSGPN